MVFIKLTCIRLYGGCTESDENPFKPRGAKALVADELRNLEAISAYNTRTYQSKKVRRSIRDSLGDVSGEPIDLSSPPMAVVPKTFAHTHSFEKNASDTK